MTAGEPGSFSELQALIDADTTGLIELDKDYVMSSDEKPIYINKTITIDGKGFKLDANNLNATLVAVSQVTLKDIVFINGNCTTEFSIDGTKARGTVNLLKESAGSTIDSCIFKDNAALMGGAIYWTTNEGTLTNSRFENNSAKSAVDGVTSQGGAIYWTGDDGKIDNCNFTGNNVTHAGGAIYFNGADNQLITNSYFYNNTCSVHGSNSGGAIYYYNSRNGRIEKTNFNENAVKGAGGAVYIDKNSKNQSIVDSSFSKNVAEGLSGSGNAASFGYGGGAIYWAGSDGSIVNTNFTENFAKS